MIKFPFVIASVLLSSLISSPFAIGQEPPKPVAAPKERTAGFEEASRRALKELESVTDRVAEVVNDQDGATITSDDPKGKVAKPTPLRRTFSTGSPILATRSLSSTFDALETNFGLELADADDALRAQLELPSGQGVVVVAVKPGSLAEHAGLKLNDVLLNLGDEPASNVASAKKVLLGLGKGALEVKLIREGKPNRMSLVGPDHGFPPESAQFWIGVPVSPVDATLRAHLPSLSADTGLIVNDVVKGSPADAAGIQKSDVFVAMSGKPLKNSDQLIEQIQASAGKPVPLEILRAGKPITIQITPAKRTHPTTINVPGSLATQYRLFAAPQLGVETTPYLKDGNVHLYYDSLNTFQYPTYKADGPIDLQLHLRGTPAKADTSTTRIEAQLAEMSGKLDAIRKLLEDIKKLESK
jgi:membrane-associated protease RseP (regulator of RpoE activity)